MKSNSIAIRVLLPLVFSALLTACGKDSPTKSDGNKVEPWRSPVAESCNSKERLGEDGPYMDPSTNTRDCAQLNATYAYMKGLQVNAKSGSFYSKIFSSTSAAGPIKFFNDRVHLIFPQYAPIKVKAGSEESDIPGGSGGTVAVNVGFLYWLLGREHSYTFSAGQLPLATTSPYVGYIQLGEVFSKTNRLFQASTLVHEARHSDCEDPSSSICGLPHGKCPEGHSLEGQVACDVGGIGPYFTEAIYMKAVGEACTTCTEAEKQAALLISAESMSRVANIEQIKSGRETRFSLPRMRGESAADFRAKAKMLVNKRRGGQS